MEYLIAEGSTSDKLEKNVNNLIKEGWKPLGGVCRSDDEKDCYFLQAMIRN